jgi:hypothetical protein
MFTEEHYAMHPSFKTLRLPVIAAPLFIISTPALVIAQHSSRFDPGDRHGTLNRTRILKQGDNSLSFYSALAAPES